VRKAVSAELQRKFRLTLAKNRARHRGTEQIGVFIHRAGAQRRPNVIANKLFAQIFDVGGGSSGGERFSARGFEVLLLADVTDHGDHFATVIFLEPRNDDGSIEAPE